MLPVGGGPFCCGFAYLMTDLWPVIDRFLNKYVIVRVKVFVRKAETIRRNSIKFLVHIFLK